MELLRGTLSGLPPEKKTTVRVFLSSTFSDTYAERNAFIRDVQPKMYEFCRNRGLDFQVADMRWGVRDEATDHHATTAVVLDSLHNCMQVSHGPAFLGILGDRYGSRLLPANIESQEFDLLVSTAIANEIDTSNLTTWYRKDKNAIPDTHVLQPITKILPHYGDEDPENKELADADNHSWNQIDAELKSLLRDLVKIAFEAGTMTEEDGFKYWWSVTEEEMITALTYADRNSKCMISMRKLDHINTHDPIASRYIDLKRSGELDTEAQILLHHEKDNRVPERLSAENIHYYNVAWSKTGVDPNYIRHQTYLRGFCRDVEEHLCKQIEQASSQQSADNADHQVREVLRHLHICRSHLDSFAGREDVLEEIHQCLLQQDPPVPKTEASMMNHNFMMDMSNITDDVSEIDNMDPRDKPLEIPLLCLEVDAHDLLDSWMFFDFESSGFTNKTLLISGPSGSGKTDLVCAIFHRAITWFPNCTRIIRFVRATHQSSTDRRLILSILHQIAKIYGFELPDSTLLNSCSLTTLSIIFNVLLSKAATADRPLLLIIDDLERLNDSNILEILPATLPANVYLIMTHSCEMDVLTGHERFKVFKMPALSDADEKCITKKMIRRRNRRLTRAQFDLLTEKVSECPLTIRTLTSLVDLWHSYDVIDDETVKKINSAKTTDAALSFYLDHLEFKHGYALVSRAFGYLALSRVGLSHGELEDVLSLDDEVLQDSYVHQLPPDPSLIRLPQLLWRRVHDDAKFYLSEMYGGCFYVLKWQHWQFVKVTTERYVPRDSEIRKQMHSMMADYFIGHWHDRVKPLELYKHKKGSYPDCKRGVPAQPLYSSYNQVNVRVLDELPVHLRESGRCEELLDKCFCNPEWVAAHVSSHSVSETLRMLMGSLHKLSEFDQGRLRRFIIGVRLVMDAAGPHNGERLMEQLFYLTLDEALKKSAVVRVSSGDLEAFIKNSVAPHFYPVTPCVYLPHTMLREKQMLRFRSDSTRCLRPFLELDKGRILALDLHRQFGTGLRLTTTDIDFENNDCGLLKRQVKQLRAFIPQQNWIVASVLLCPTNDTSDILVDSKNWQEVHHSHWDTQRITSIEVDPAGHWMAVYQEDDRAVSVWDLSSKSCSTRIALPDDGPPIRPSSFCWNRSGRYLLALEENSTHMAVLDIESKSSFRHILNFPLLGSARGNADSFVLSGRGLIFFNPQTKRAVNAAGFTPTRPISLLRAAKSGCFLMTGGEEGDEEPIHVWDLMEGHHVVSDIHEHGGHFVADFFNENRWLVFTCPQKYPHIVLWLFGRGAGNYYEQAIKLRYIVGHTQQVYGLFFSETADIFFSFGADHRVLRWSRSAVEEEAMTHLFRARQRASGRLTATSASTPNAEPREDPEEAVVHRTTGLVVSHIYQLLAVTRSSGWLMVHKLPAMDKDDLRLCRGYPTTLTDLEVCDRWLAFIAGGESVYVWDLKTLTEFHKLSIPRRGVSCFALATEFIVVCSGGGPDRVGVALFYDLKTGDTLEEMSCPNGFSKIIIGPNENYVATHRGNIPIIFHRNSRITPAPAADRFPSTAECTCLEMSDDGRVVATGDADGVIRVLDAFTGHLISHMRQKTAVTVSRFIESSNGLPLRLVTGGTRHLFVWLVVAQKLERAIERHAGPLTLLAFTADRRFLVSVGKDLELVLWNVDGWTCLTSLNIHWPITCVAATADLSHLYVDCNSACAPFTVLVPNASLSELLVVPVDGEDKEESDTEESGKTKFVTQAKGVAEAFSAPSRSSKSEVCVVL